MQYSADLLFFPVLFGDCGLFKILVLLYLIWSVLIVADEYSYLALLCNFCVVFDFGSTGPWNGGSAVSFAFSCELLLCLHFQSSLPLYSCICQKLVIIIITILPLYRIQINKTTGTYSSLNDHLLLRILLQNHTLCSNAQDERILTE